MSIGAVYADGDDLWCKLGERPDKEDAPYAPLKFADENQENFNYSCDELRKRYFIYPKNLLPAQTHGMIADIRAVRLYNNSYFSDTPKFTLPDHEIERLLKCAKKTLRQKIKRYLS